MLFLACLMCFLTSLRWARRLSSVTPSSCALPLLGSRNHGECLGQTGGLSFATAGSYPPSLFICFLLVLARCPLGQLRQVCTNTQTVNCSG